MNLKRFTLTLYLHVLDETMELTPYDRNTSCDDQMSLSEIMQVQDQPVSEEQAWALCYQLCSLLCQHQFSHKTWTCVLLPAAEGVVFSRDGNVSIRVTDNGNYSIYILFL